MTSNYLRLLVISSCVAVILCQAFSILTPKQHAEKLRGDMFCARRDPLLFKNICKEAARRERITGYDESLLDGLTCKEDDAGKVLLDPGNGGPWEKVQDALLECKFKRAPNDIVTKVFGRGLKTHDVFEYVWDDDRSAYIVDSLRGNMLLNLI